MEVTSLQISCLVEFCLSSLPMLENRSIKFDFYGTYLFGDSIVMPECRRTNLELCFVCLQRASRGTVFQNRLF